MGHSSIYSSWSRFFVHTTYQISYNSSSSSVHSIYDNCCSVYDRQRTEALQHNTAVVMIVVRVINFRTAPTHRQLRFVFPTCGPSAHSILRGSYYSSEKCMPCSSAEHISKKNLERPKHMIKTQAWADNHHCLFLLSPSPPCGLP